MSPTTADRTTLRIEDLDDLRNELDQADWLETDPLAHTLLRPAVRRAPSGRSRIRRPAPRWAGYGR